MPIYRIDSPGYKNGSAWDRTYRSRRAAVAAIADACRMSEVYLGPAFCDGDGDDDDEETSWCVYDSREARDRDDTGAWAPRVTRCRK